MVHIPLIRPATTLGAALGAVAAVGIAATPAPARACGGTFCDAGPTAMPVDQTGENILFTSQVGPVAGIRRSTVSY